MEEKKKKMHCEEEEEEQEQVEDEEEDDKELQILGAPIYSWEFKFSSIQFKRLYCPLQYYKNQTDFCLRPHQLCYIK